MARKASPAAPRGRKKGAKNHDYAQAKGELTRCPNCGSTDRTPYWSHREVDAGGYRCTRCLTTGQQTEACLCGGTFKLPYTHVVWRKTQCRACGQVRVDRHVENRRRAA